VSATRREMRWQSFLSLFMIDSHQAYCSCQFFPFGLNAPRLLSRGRWCGFRQAARWIPAANAVISITLTVARPWQGG
jgi:hypothetical protein